MAEGEEKNYMDVNIFATCTNGVGWREKQSIEFMSMSSSEIMHFILRANSACGQRQKGPIEMLRLLESKGRCD